MTGLRGINEFYELNLVRVTDNGKITFWAVVPNTFDSIMRMVGDSANSHSQDVRLQNIKMDYLGPIQVQRLEGDA